MTIHALRRAKERYKMDLTITDLDTIISLIKMGFGKEVTYPKNVYGFKDNNKRYFHLRYNSKLIEPVIADLDKNPVIVTFMPTGKKTSWKKTCYNKTDKDFIEKIKRLNGR